MLHFKDSNILNIFLPQEPNDIMCFDYTSVVTKIKWFYCNCLKTLGGFYCANMMLCFKVLNQFTLHY